MTYDEPSRIRVALAALDFIYYHFFVFERSSTFYLGKGLSGLHAGVDILSLCVNILSFAYVLLYSLCVIHLSQLLSFINTHKGV